MSDIERTTALHVLEAIDSALLPQDEMVTASGRINWPKVEQAFPMLSDTEKILATTALSLYTGQSPTVLDESGTYSGVGALLRLDQRQFLTVIVALKARKAG